MNDWTVFDLIVDFVVDWLISLFCLYINRSLLNPRWRPNVSIILWFWELHMYSCGSDAEDKSYVRTCSRWLKGCPARSSPDWRRWNCLAARGCESLSCNREQHRMLLKETHATQGQHRAWRKNSQSVTAKAEIQQHTESRSSNEGCTQSKRRPMAYPHTQSSKHGTKRQIKRRLFSVWAEHWLFFSLNLKWETR